MQLNYMPPEIVIINSIKDLGVHLNNVLSWSERVVSVYKKTTKRVYHITLLKRSDLQSGDLRNVYFFYYSSWNMLQ